MTEPSYTTTILVPQSADRVFAAVTDPRGWWSENITGDTRTRGAVFYYHYRDVHRATFEITELVPGKKVVWHVLHNAFSFLEDKTEWTGTDVVFEITPRGDQTELRFTHVGLTPAYECHALCVDAWGTYIEHSLFDLITTGHGDPTRVGQQDRAQQRKELAAAPSA